MTRIVTQLSVTESTVGEGNWDANRGPVQLIILHTIVGNIQAADAEFNRPNSQKSAHYGVGYDGSITHWVDEDKVAYHAGDYDINQRSIGIEHQDNGMVNGVYDDGARPEPLYATSAKLVADICTFWGIPVDREHIKKHSEVAKTACPDALDVERIVKEAQILTGQVPEVKQIKVKVIAEKGLNARSSATTSGSIVTVFTKGTILDVVSTTTGEPINNNNNWDIVESGGQNVYIWSGGVEEVKVEKPKETPKPKEEKPVDKDKIIRDLQKENKRLLDTIKKLNELTNAFVQVVEAPAEKQEVAQGKFNSLLQLLHLA